MAKNLKSSVLIIISGIVIGMLIGLLSLYGNPLNMGLCEINFIRDIAGTLGLHNVDIFKYYRPEITSVILGSFAISIIRKKYKLTLSRAGIVKMLLGFCTMIFGMIFLGSPLRTIERMAGGDLNAYIAFIALIIGMIVGYIFINKGYNIKDTEKTYKNPFSKFILPGILLIGLIILILDTYGNTSGNKIFKVSEAGPASVHASVMLAILFSFIIGILLEITELSFDNTFNNIVYKKNFAMLISGICMFIILLILNYISYNLNFSFDGQIVAHKASIWNFISMFGVGLALMLADGDPLRQMIKAGEGSIDSMLYIVGMFLACIIIYPLKLTGAAYSMLPNGTWFVGGPVKNGMIATIICMVIVITIACMGKVDKKGRK